MFRFLVTAFTLLYAVSAQGQTWVQPQWGMNTAINPYNVSIRLGTQFYSIGTMSAAGLWTPDIANVAGTAGHKIPYLDAANSWSAKQTFTTAPRINALTGYVSCSGSGADCSASVDIGSNVITGVVTVSDAAAGYIGEVLSSVVLVGSQVSLTSTIVSNVTSLALTAGDWEVSGTVAFNPAGTTTVSHVSAGINTTSATLQTVPDANGLPTATVTATLTTGAAQRLNLTPERINVATTTTVYLVAQSTFGVSTMGAYGVIRARRVR